MTTRLDVIIDADTRGVQTGLDDTGREFGRMGDTAKLAGAAVAAGLAVAAGAVVNLGIDSISAASDLNETLNKSKVIFGKYADEIEAFGETAAESLGLSKEAAIEAATGFGDMFTQLGQTREEAAQTSTDVVQLAADLGSFNNLETADVVDRISAAFRGEYDSLQLLIPNINAARVEKEALAETGKTLASDLTAEEKAMATLAIVTRDGEKAAGDFERTSEDLANQQKILKANLEDVRAEIGQKLTPIATAFFEYLNDTALPNAEELGGYLDKKLGPIFSDVADFITKDLIPAFEDLKPASDDLLEQMGDTAESVSDLLDELRELSETLGGDGDLSNSIASGIGSWVGFFIGNMEKVQAAIGKVVDAVAFLIDKIEKLNALAPNLPGDLGISDGSGGGGSGGGGSDPRFNGGPLDNTPRRVSVDVNLNNGIVSDPIGLGDAIVNAIDRRNRAAGLES